MGALPCQDDVENHKSENITCGFFFWIHVISRPTVLGQLRILLVEIRWVPCLISTGALWTLTERSVRAHSNVLHSLFFCCRSIYLHLITWRHTVFRCTVFHAICARRKINDRFGANYQKQSKWKSKMWWVNVCTISIANVAMELNEQLHFTCDLETFFSLFFSLLIEYLLWISTENIVFNAGFNIMTLTFHSYYNNTIIMEMK